MSGFQRYFWRSIQVRSCSSSDQSPARSATQPAAPVACSRRASAFSFARLAWRSACAAPPFALPLDPATASSSLAFARDSPTRPDAGPLSAARRPSPRGARPSASLALVTATQRTRPLRTRSTARRPPPSLRTRSPRPNGFVRAFARLPSRSPRPAPASVCPGAVEPTVVTRPLRVSTAVMRPAGAAPRRTVHQVHVRPRVRGWPARRSSAPALAPIRTRVRPRRVARALRGLAARSAARRRRAPTSAGRPRRRGRGRRRSRWPPMWRRSSTQSGNRP